MSHTKSTNQEAIKETASLIKETIKADTGRVYKQSNALELAAKIHALPSWNHAQKSSIKAQPNFELTAKSTNEEAYFFIDTEKELYLLPEHITTASKAFSHISQVLKKKAKDILILDKPSTFEEKRRFLDQLVKSTPEWMEDFFWVGLDAKDSQFCVLGYQPDLSGGKRFATKMNEKLEAQCRQIFKLSELYQVFNLYQKHLQKAQEANKKKLAEALALLEYELPALTKCGNAYDASRTLKNFMEDHLNLIPEVEDFNEVSEVLLQLGTTEHKGMGMYLGCAFEFNDEGYLFCSLYTDAMIDGERDRYDFSIRDDVGTDGINWNKGCRILLSGHDEKEIQSLENTLITLKPILEKLEYQD